MAECEYIEACRMAYGEEGCEPACDLDLPCYLYKPKVDRDALMALANEMEEFGNLPVKHPGIRVLHNDDFSRELGYARRIREALGASE